MSKSEELAREFEALICEVQTLAIEIDAMKVANREREIQYEAPMYHEADFRGAADTMRQFAVKFRSLGR